MSGIAVLLLLILISSFLAIAVFFWFRLARFSFPVWLFFCSLLAGATSYFPALLLYRLVPSGGIWATFGMAFAEEFSRLPLLIVLFIMMKRFTGSPERPPAESDGEGEKEVSMLALAAAAGLVAGLGFAILEGPSYRQDYNIVLRAFTAAPLHGACGSRVGSSVALFRERPIRSISLFLFAVAIHGAYNIMLNIPGMVPFFAAIFIALSALASSAMTIRSGMKSQEM